MPDYSFCNNENCPSNKKCARYLGIPSEWQSYANFDPGSALKCTSFMKAETAPFKCRKTFTPAWRWAVKNTRGQIHVTSLHFSEEEIKRKYPLILGRIEETRMERENE